jgi:hypothetical protein
MRAKLVNEKFIEKTDPIKDMGIGEFKLKDLIKDFSREEYTPLGEWRKKWHIFLSNLLNGKTIEAELQRYPSMTVKRGVIKVKNVIKSDYEDYFVRAENGGRYRISPDKPMYILNDES